jgi:purine-nucleoside phosphorylase
LLLSLDSLRVSIALQDNMIIPIAIAIVIAIALRYRFQHRKLMTDRCGSGIKGPMTLEQPTEYEAALRAAGYIREQTGPVKPIRMGLVTGSGLGALAEIGDEVAAIPFEDIPGLGGSTVAGHAGQLKLLDRNGQSILCLMGRRHLYEGIDPKTAVFGVRLMQQLQAGMLILTNSAGGLSPRLWPGDLMLIADHINLMFRNPLVGANDDQLGERFPDMSEPYDCGISSSLHDAALLENVKLKEGVYAGLTGPTYESKAEVDMLRRLGADAVGMSTVPEVIAAKHAGLPIAAISLITNSHVHPADPPTHEEVLEMGRQAGGRLLCVLQRFFDGNT